MQKKYIFWSYGVKFLSVKNRKNRVLLPNKIRKEKNKKKYIMVRRSYGTKNAKLQNYGLVSH